MEDNFQTVIEILKKPILDINTELDFYFDNLNQNEVNDFLKWFEFVLLNRLKINKEVMNSSNRINNRNTKKGHLLKIKRAEFNQKVEYIENWINDKKEINQTEVAILINDYLGQPTNDKANEFFEFLIENYRPDEKTKVKFVNILHFLKNDADKKHFIFKVKQNEYKKMIENKGIKISKFEKSANYEDVEKHIFRSLETTFLKTKPV
jgi:hypothetical protein